MLSAIYAHLACTNQRLYRACATGQRQDNLNAKWPGSLSTKGFRFFQDDEDEFGLEDILQAVCWLEASQNYLKLSNH